jgi:mono/diheme cytochrome c family protein
MTILPSQMQKRDPCLSTLARNSRPVPALLLVWVVWISIMVAGCSERPAAPPKVSENLPAVLQEGEAKFNVHCAGCHGVQGQGTDQGPPLVHKIYEPSHHGDGAFHRAAASGVRAHHWQFGNMPKIPGVTKEDVGHIVQYVRWLQRQAGIL